MWWDYILSYCSNHRMFPGKTNPKQTGQKQRCWQLRPTKQENTSEEITADELNWVQWKKDTTHLCDPETLGCWSSFSAWVKAMTLSPRAKATKALQARMEHLDMRVQLLIDSSLEARAERRQVCWRERRIKKKMRPYPTGHLPQVFNLLFPQRRRRSCRQDFISLLPLPTTVKKDNRKRLFSTQVYTKASLY